MRRRPEATKRYMLQVAIVVCGSVLLSLWVYSLGVTLTAPEPETTTAQDDGMQPFSVLKDNLALPSW